MQYASQASVIDALLSMIAALPAVANANPPIEVFDGFPGPNRAPTFISIGGLSDPTVSNGNVEWADLGARSRYERYDVNGYVVCWVGGDDNLGQRSPSDAQKASRDQASSVVQAIEAQLLADPNLSEQNGGVALVAWTLLGVNRVLQTPPDDPSASKGRWAQYDFCIEVYNRLAGAY